MDKTCPNTAPRTTEAATLIPITPTAALLHAVASVPACAVVMNSATSPVEAFRESLNF